MGNDCDVDKDPDLLSLLLPTYMWTFRMLAFLLAACASVRQAIIGELIMFVPGNT